MDLIHPVPRAPSGVLGTVRSFLGAGSACGLLFGLADGIVAAAVGSASLGILSFLGCLAGAVFQYLLIGALGLGLLALPLHPFLAKKPDGRRYLFALRLGLMVGLFAEIYWWTRPFVFYGRSAVSPERFAASVVMLAIAWRVAWYLGSALALAPARAKTAAAALAGIAWLSGAVYMAFQAGAIGSRGELNERNRDLPNVLLVIVDALRDDVLGCYGNQRVKTPAIDALASRGVVFENAFTQAPFTWTSFGSMLTGKYPRRHGLVKMAPGVRMAPNVTLPLHLKSATKRDGTRLLDGDWIAGTFHTGTLTEASGLLGGFDLRFEATAGHGLVVLDRPWSVFRADLLIWIAWEKLVQRFVPSSTAFAARKFLDEHGDRRFFAMVHIYSTHTPYDPPHEFREMYCDRKYDGPVKSFWAAHRQIIERGEYKPTPADVDQIRNLYYAGVSQADREIGQLVAALERQGALEDTLVIVTSDHGESLGERDLWEHDHMVQTNLRIPLVLSWPKGLPPGKRVGALVDEIDLFPTVCDLLGIGLPPGAEGSGDPKEDRKRIDGRSLLPLVRGEEPMIRLHSFAENGLYISAQDGRRKLIVRRETLSEADGWKNALEGRPESPELYDLEADPEENTNMVQHERDEAERLFAVIRDWNEKLPIPIHDVQPSHRDMENLRRRLIELGYTGDGIGIDEPQGK
ncbi:MAG: sulfatase [Planctomycetota bacterium]